MRTCPVLRLLPLLALLELSCASSRDVLPQSDDSDIGQLSLALSDDGSGIYQLSVSKDAVSAGTEYLLSTSALLTDMGEPSFNGMLSRVVFFKRADGELQMLESQKGTAIDPALTKPGIIASFPIVSEDATTLGVDFNAGIENLLVAFDWSSSDGAPPPFVFQDRFAPAKLIQRYVDEGKTDDKGRVTIRQVVQAQLSQYSSTTMELRYFCSRMNLTPPFQPSSPNRTFVGLDTSRRALSWSPGLSRSSNT